MTPEMRLDATVRGRVQGVGFRYFVLEWAADLDLRGWVANDVAGAVRVVAEGPRDRLERLLDALRRGPAGARVDGVTPAWLPASGGLDRFAVRSRFHCGD